MAEGIGGLIGVLGNAAIKEIALISGVDDERKWLETELVFMKAYIEDVEAKSSLQLAILSEIQKLSEEAEKVLYDFIQPRSFWYRIIHPLKKRHFANQIKSFKQTLVDLKDRREVFDIQHMSGEEVSRPIVVRRGSIRDKEDLIGFEDIASTLRDELLFGESSRKVVSIFGMGGLGKTALVKKLYHSNNLTDVFKCRAWVKVTQSYDINSLVPMVISSLMTHMTPEEVSEAKKNAHPDPVRFLEDFLIGRRYLVVVDDLWDSKAWDELQSAFPCNNTHSRVIVTTRKKTMAELAATEASVHKLRFLSLEESRNLFNRELRENPVTGDFKSLAETMVNKCGGLPLAITLLGKMLKLAGNDIREWRQVNEEDVWGPLTRYMEKIDSKKISKLFTLSYDDLAGDEQKPLLLYMGMFPSGHEVDINKLISMWIAEQHDINKTSDTSNINKTEVYLNMLIDNSFIVQEGSFWGKPSTCKVVHDLVKYLIIQKAKNVGYFDIFPPPNYNGGNDMRSKRHAIHGQANQYVSSLESSTSRQDKRDVRALLVFDTTSSASSLANQCAQFKRLEILDLTGIDFSSARKELSKMLRKITSLKFLVLADTLIPIVPSNISKQKYLLFLDTGTSSLYELPKKSIQLDQLRHLHGFFHSSSYLPQAKDLLSVRVLNPTPNVDLDITTNLLNFSNKKLQELSLRCKPNDSLHHIARLQNLVTLIIFLCESDPGNCVKYEKLPAIDSLSSCKNLANLWLDGPLASLPKREMFPKFLQRLILSRSQLKDDPMATLETLPYLNSLELMNAYDGANLVCSSRQFPVLMFLRLFKVKNLRNWEVQEKAMPRLQGLTISECPQLILPQRFQDFPNAGKTKSMYGVPQYTDYIPPQPQAYIPHLNPC